MRHLKKLIFKNIDNFVIIVIVYVSLKMPLLKLDDPTLIRIAKFLTPSELIAIESCSKKWKTCVKHSPVWSYHLHRLWEPLNKPWDYSLLDRIVEIPISTIKDNLINHVDCSECFSTMDYQKLFMARLFFRNTNYHSHFPLIMKIPKWCIEMNVFKLSYFFALREACRTNVLKSEILAAKWKCYFTHSLEEEAGWTCIFYDDGTLYSAMHETPMIWGFSAYDFFEGASRVQVEQYVPLKVKRSEEGLWIFQNMYAVFKQVDYPDPKIERPII